MKTILRILLIAAMCAPVANAQQWCSNQLEQPFPTTGAEETRWRLCWRFENGPGLIISHAFFRTSPTGPWIRVLWDARLSQLFVPYHQGTRFLDIGSNPPIPLSIADCPASAGGTLLSSEVCRQVKDRGLAWKSGTMVRRGQELMLWSAISAGNYNYVIEWVFRDDGMIIGRVGATSQNLPWMPFTTHTHDAMWRLDVDFNGACCDTVMTMSHAEAGAGGNDAMATVTTERGIAWDPVAFTTLHVVDQFLKNSKGSQSGFHFMPLRYGTQRHTEDFSTSDLWVTRYRWNENHAENLPQYVANQEATANSDIVLWYTGSVHHMYRDEDGFDENGWWNGSALLMYTEFQFKPMNLFAKTPLYP